MNIHDLVPDIEVNAGLPWFLEAPTEAISAYLGEEYLVIDLETTNKDKGSPLNTDNHIVCACFRWAGQEPEFRWGSELEQVELIQAIEYALEQHIPIVAHAAKFELGWFKRMGFDLHEFFVYDTMLGDYVLRGNRRHMRLDLGTVARRWGYPTGKERTIDALMKAGVCPSEMPEDLLRARVIKDVRQTDFIFRRQRRKLHASSRLPVLFTRCITTPWLADIEFNGLALNRERVYEEYARALKEYNAALKEFDDFSGGINPNSPQQMAAFIYNHLGFVELQKHGKPIRNAPSKAFPDGQPKTDDETLNKLKAATAKQKKFLELRKRVGSLGAELSKTLEFFKGVVDEYDGHFYGIFNQHVTKTQRLASQGRKLQFETIRDKAGKPKIKSVQFQNLPRKFKDLLQPKREGWWQWEIDGSQLEYRTAIFLGQDANGMEAIRNDLDIHKYSAMALYNLKDVKLVKKDQRQHAKPTTFRPLYGGSQGTPGQLRYFKWWREFHGELEEVQEGWTYEVLKTKRLVTPWGLRYYWPYTRMSADGYIDNKTNIYNYPVQALATAEIIPVACVYMWHRMNYMGLRAVMTNTVHDSGIGECPDNEREIIKQLGFWCFTMDVYEYLEAVYNLDFNVPLGAEVKIGSRWSLADYGEWEINVERDGDAWWKGEREDLSLYKALED